MGKVLDLTTRLTARNSSEIIKNDFKAEILDMTEARQEVLSKERRDVKRTILTEFVGAFVILPERGLMKVALYDISDSGVSFDIEVAEGHFAQEEEIAMRVYLNHSTYFPFTVTVSNSRLIEEDGVIRHGAGFVKGTVNDVALYHFVKFIENVSASLKRDSGDILVSNIS